jgi:hypothetical protein
MADDAIVDARRGQSADQADTSGAGCTDENDLAHRIPFLTPRTELLRCDFPTAHTENPGGERRIECQLHRRRPRAHSGPSVTAAGYVTFSVQLRP